MRSKLAWRLAGVVVAAALIVVGVLLAARPVSDEGLRAHATEATAGVVVSAHTMWGGSQVLAVSWLAANGQPGRTQLEDYNGFWQAGSKVDLMYNPSHPGTDAVLAHPAWTFTQDFRTDAVFQAVVPFTLAGIVVALAVIWPAGPWLFGDRARRARRSLRRYVLTPAVFCAIAVAGSVLIQDQRASAYSRGADKIVGWLSVVLMLLLIWPYVRALQYYRLRQLLTVPDDAAGTAVISSIVGRHLDMGAVQMVALSGQRPREFRSGARVNRYGRWERRGPALVTDGEQLLIGFARRLAPEPQDAAAPATTGGQPDSSVDIITEPLISQYPQLAGKPLLRLMKYLILPVVVAVGSIAILVLAGRVALGPLWAVWLFCILMLGGPIWRYRQLSRLLRLPHVARDGVITSLTTSKRGAVMPIIAMPAGRTVRLRLIGEPQVSWLAAGQAVVLHQPPTLSSDAVLLATEDGHAALAITTVVPAQDVAAVGSAS
jgi:hypothetical protein